MVSEASTTRLSAGNGPPVLPWLTHLYTASGAVIAFLALLAIIAADYRAAFLWMAASIVVDATDGWLARRARVKERLPSFDGARLDDIVDYLTFVFLPAFLIYRADLLPPGWALAVVAAILLASGYAFSSADAKTDDYFFTGFPSYWNIVSFYLYAAGAPRLFNAALLVALCVMVFVRIGYVYPSRTPTLRRTTVTLGILWGVLMLSMVWQVPVVDRRLLAVSLAFPLYYTLLSFYLHARRARG